MAKISSLAFFVLVLPMLCHQEMESTHYEKTHQQTSVCGLCPVRSVHGPFQLYGSFHNIGLCHTLPSWECTQSTVTTPEEDNGWGSAVLSVPIESFPRVFRERRQGGLRACTSRTSDTPKSVFHCRQMSNTTRLVLLVEHVTDVTVPVPLCMHSLRATDIVVLAGCENATGMMARERMFYSCRLVSWLLRASCPHNATVVPRSLRIDVEYHGYPRMIFSACLLPHEDNPINISLICLLQPHCIPVMYTQHNHSTIDVDNPVKTCRNASTAQTVLPSHLLSTQFHCVICFMYLLVTTMLIQSHLRRQDHRDRNRKSTEQGTNVGIAAFSIESCTEKDRPDVRQYSSCKPPWKRKTDVLHDIIHHLWRLPHRGMNDTNSHTSVTLHQRGNSKCHSSTSPLCSVCEHHVRHHLRRTKRHTNTYTESKMSAISNMVARLFRPSVIHVYPVTRFLPDPTRIPHQDLAHVGYRLATLSALPSSVPVSRIRLADAGFYSRGVNDEVTCYSCHVQHSGWTIDDHPMEVHRRLSPNCPHVLQSDGQPAAPGPAAVASGGSRSNDAFHHHQDTASVPANSHVEDGDGSSLVTNSGHTSVLINGTTDPRTQHNENEPTPSARRTETSPSTSASRTDTSSATRTNAEPQSSSNARPASGNVSRPVEQASVNSTGRRPGTPNTSPERTNPGPEAVASITVSGSSVTSISDVRGPSSSAASENPRRSLFPRPRLELGGAVYPMYQSVDSRRRTFTNWDDSRAPPLNEVLLSGMFYAGYSDCVRCFYCGVGLKHWVVTDDVWTEHVRWRPECQYLRSIKGDDFIRETQRRLANTSSAPTERSNRNPNTPPSAASHPTTLRSANTSAAAPTTTTSPSMTAATATSSAARAPSVGLGTTGMPPTGGSSSSRANDAEGGAGNTTGGATATMQVNADQQQALAHLQAENRNLTRNMQCRVCRRAPVNTLLLPCGHLVVCETCAGSVTSCPLCSQRIQAITRVYLA